jgi:hypothetical protein
MDYVGHAFFALDILGNLLKDTPLVRSIIGTFEYVGFAGYFYICQQESIKHRQ